MSKLRNDKAHVEKMPTISAGEKHRVKYTDP